MDTVPAVWFTFVMVQPRSALLVVPVQLWAVLPERSVISVALPPNGMLSVSPDTTPRVRLADMVKGIAGDRRPPV